MTKAFDLLLSVISMILSSFLSLHLELVCDPFFTRWRVSHVLELHHVDGVDGTETCTSPCHCKLVQECRAWTSKHHALTDKIGLIELIPDEMHLPHEVVKTLREVSHEYVQADGDANVQAKLESLNYMNNVTCYIVGQEIVRCDATLRRERILTSSPVLGAPVLAITRSELSKVQNRSPMS